MTLIDSTVPLTLADSIGGIMAALVKAQEQSARATMDFVNEVGIQADGETEPGELRTARFRFQKLDENDELNEFNLEVPLLSMVEIPTISVSKAKVSFSYDITKTDPSEPPATAATSDPPNRFLSNPAILTGRFVRQPVSTDSSSSSASSKTVASLDVTVEIERAALPIGLERVLEMLELASAESREGSDAPEAGDGG